MAAQPDSVGAVNRAVVAFWAADFATRQPPPHWALISPEPVTGGLAVVGCNPALPQSNYYTIPLFAPDSIEAHLQSLPGLEAMAR